MVPLTRFSIPYPYLRKKYTKMKNVKNGKGKIGNKYDEDVNLNVRNVKKRKMTDWACFYSDWNDHLNVPFVIMIMIVLIEVGELPKHFLKIWPLHIGQHF
jgi:hypothetical protein